MGETSMRYYFHILTDQERLRDPDGEEFSSLAVARTEATQCARDLIAERLRCGRAAPSQWCIHVAQEDDTIVHTVPFAPLLLGEDDHGGQHEFGRKSHGELFASAIATSNQARTTHAQITRHLTELKYNLRMLTALSKAFSRHERK